MHDALQLAGHAPFAVPASHASPVSTTPLPQTGAMHMLVLKIQALVQERLPPMKESKLEQEVIGDQLLPSHCSPALMMPSPHTPGVPPVHSDTLNVQATGSQLNDPPVKLSNALQLEIGPQLLPSHCSPG